MKKFTYLLIGAIISIPLVAQEKTADDLVKSMKKADITYAQLMQGMGMAKNNIDMGIISMNEFLVERGIDLIRTHPAPKSKPWLIIDKENQDGFKSMLVYFDKKMDEDVEAIEKALKLKDWQKAMEASNELSNSCISCHITYKDKVKYIME